MEYDTLVHTRLPREYVSAIDALSLHRSETRSRTLAFLVEHSLQEFLGEVTDRAEVIAEAARRIAGVNQAAGGRTVGTVRNAGTETEEGTPVRGEAAGVPVRL